jgi:magnesium transporter
MHAPPTVSRLQRRFTRRRSSVGGVPGALPDEDAGSGIGFRIIQYGPDVHRDLAVNTPQDVAKVMEQAAADFPSASKSSVATDGSSPVIWINIDGARNKTALKLLGDTFGIHPLALEDVSNVHQHAKCEKYPNTIFFVARMPYRDEHLATEQVSVFLQQGLVITIQERPGDCLDSVRERIDKSLGRIRERDADYLFYAIIDRIVDEFFPVLESFDDQLSEISSLIESRPPSDLPFRLHHIRDDLLQIRKTSLQYRKAFKSLMSEGTDLLDADTQLFIRDCQDHVDQIVEVSDMTRETCGELRELYFAILGHKSNEISKVLTVIATVFIPMSFVSGVYGMNFDSETSSVNMPELHWTYGYPFALCLMAITGGALFLYLHRRGWLT